MSKQKLSRTPSLDVEKCIANFGGNKFDMIVYSAQRAREMSRKRRGNIDYFNAPFSALMELQEKTNGGNQV